ncbi:prepilin-type N-terminal cleavage/methylation domain-containing protein [Roseateles sp.]|uniref:type IV pilus modification PilV family protein n=1 Tax=Roseateles sp. TaxID=1971397 RepID=UPI0025D813F8|nr:prepilin-type N-terminal cleavage/methylation domain-containing protein [Roseateles sp.]MBV8035693.1 prepilin-type N-terminal cleavage/methylation domain-containing protein [Roseateles sp.]
MSELHSTSASPRTSTRQQGVTLIEALVALLVMSFGMLALVGLMSNLRYGADLAKQRSEAMRIARAEIAQMRDFSELRRASSTPASAGVYAAMLAETVTPLPVRPVTLPDSNTTYVVQRNIGSLATGGQGLTVRVNVSWTDRTGDLQFVNLDTVIASVDPVFSAVVGFTPRRAPLTQPSARNPAIPAGAKQLGKDISAFRPDALAGTVWVFNNLDGTIIGKCEIPAGTPVSTLTTADVESCINGTVGYLLSGVVRFSNTSPPNPGLPEAGGFQLGLSIVNGTYWLPRLTPQGVPVMSSGNMVLDSFVATAPAAADQQCLSDSASSPPYVSYYCVVYPKEAGPAGSRLTWSGQLVLTGFATGASAAQFRVCRYSADYNGSGGGFTADWTALENEEHPAVYAKVAGSLTRQNFLVVRGDLNCPTAPAVDPAHGVFADYSTIQLQP